MQWSHLVVFTDTLPTIPTLRIHSECLTGDVFKRVLFFIAMLCIPSFSFAEEIVGIERPLHNNKYPLPI